MRSAALVALLPFLATLATAYPHDKHHHHHASHHPIRKSLAFGPQHPHATFEVLPEPISVSHNAFGGDVDPKDVARQYLDTKIEGGEGTGYFIRDDTYTDKSTGVTHVYARQLLNGLEVSDGDINLNIDRNGAILSWGNSFLPSGQVAGLDIESTSSQTTEYCQELEATLAAQAEHLHALKGESSNGHSPWAMVKSAAQALLGVPSSGSGSSHEIDRHAIHETRKQMKHIKNHIDAMCSDAVNGDLIGNSLEGTPSPIEALASLLPRLHPQGNLAPISLDGLESTSEHTFAPKPAPAEPPTQRISGPALASAGVLNDVPARLMVTQTSSGVPALVWKFEVEMKDNWYEAYVDVRSGEVVRVVDWASDISWAPKLSAAKGDVKTLGKGDKQKPLPPPSKPKYEPYTYNVFPFGVNDPSVGNASIVHKPWDTVASPLGWHQIPTASVPWSSKIPGMKVDGNMTTFHTTIGNNIIAHEDWEGQNNYINNYRPVNDSLTFVYDYEEPDGLAPKEYIDFVVTQLFYTSNMFHDLTYRLGFDELSGNFQAENFGLGGRGGDPVITNAQDGSGYNNANFATPPDGQSGRMRMYVWDTATPFRDGDIEAGIVIHEYSHGLSTRLTGGPANSGCLGWGEAGGMGEGWGDFLATMIRQIEEHKKFKNNTDIYAMGAWAANRDTGIRNYKYSTNSTVNPSTYKTLDKPGYWGVHAIGEVWAQILFVMAEELIDKYGFSTTLFPPTNTSAPNDYYVKTSEESFDAFGKPVPLIPKHGNTLAVQLVVDGLKLQPCRPSFFDARDAIIQADQIRTGGANTCLIWKAFAERGLGVDAKVIGNGPWGGGVRSDGWSVPKAVCK